MSWDDLLANPSHRLGTRLPFYLAMLKTGGPSLLQVYAASRTFGDRRRATLRPSSCHAHTYDVYTDFHDWSNPFPTRIQQEFRTDFLVHAFIALIIMPLNQSPKTTELLWWIDKLKGSMWFRA